MDLCRLSKHYRRLSFNRKRMISEEFLTKLDMPELLLSDEISTPLYIG